ncbi:MAG: hypothetical protein BWY55_00875 [archaeon ADurb.Bin336]|nr:MAG: hypothetical protein BWY55_00875 [archaeon ADurb.Bin336]
MLIEAQKYDKRDTIFIDFEDNRLVGLKNEELDELFVAHAELVGREAKYLFFDEIQAMPNWSKFIRRLHNTKKYCIVVTGSSSKLLSKEIATELRGRYISKLLFPLTFSEYLRFRGFEYKKTTEFTSKKGVLLKLLNEYIEEGGFPAIVNKNEFEKKELIKTYFDTIFYKDIVERYKIGNSDLIEQLLNYLLENNAELFSITNFHKILKDKGVATSKKTISQYLKYIEDTFFILTSEKFSYSPKVRLQNPKKIYLVDNSFQTILSNNFTPNTGKKLESIVMNQLFRTCDKIYYYKEKKECDFIIKQNSTLKAIQVCLNLSDKNKEREINGLLDAMQKNKINEGIIITLNQKEQLNEKGVLIKVVPVWQWLLEND